MSYNVEETVHHLFIDRQFIKEISYYIHDVTQNHKTISTNYRNGHCHFIRDTIEDKHWKRIKIVTCFVIL
jgi:hypothetical protein